MRLSSLTRKATRRVLLVFPVIVAGIVLQGVTGSAQRRQPPADAPHTAVIAEYCSGCHNDKLKSGGMTLTQLDPSHPERSAELAEKVIRKLKPDSCLRPVHP